MIDVDPRFADFPDYIIGPTKDIWHDRGIAAMHQYYTREIVVRSRASAVEGIQRVIANTMATLAGFPDRTPSGKDKIRKQPLLHRGEV